MFQADSVRDAAFGCDWVGTPIPFQRCLMFILATANKVFQLTAGKFVPVSNVTMMNVCIIYVCMWYIYIYIYGRVAIYVYSCVYSRIYISHYSHLTPLTVVNMVLRMKEMKHVVVFLTKVKLYLLQHSGRS